MSWNDSWESMGASMDWSPNSSKSIPSTLFQTCVLMVASRGHLRTNAGGHNLNREWAHPRVTTPRPWYDRPKCTTSFPKIQETGVDAFLDVHGDEELPFNFLAGSEGLPNWGPRLRGLHGAFMAAYSRANSRHATVPRVRTRCSQCLQTHCLLESNRNEI